MKKIVYVLAILAAASTAAVAAAVAKDLKQEKKAPAVSATQMSDAEMDKVTAGGSIEIGPNANVYTPINGPVTLFMNYTGPNPGGTIGNPVGYHCLAGPCSP
jgi:hypothetical protein